MGAQTLHKFDLFSNLNGGWNTLSTPLLSERDKGKRMMSPNLRNVDMFYEGGISKRLGKVKQGNALAGATAWATQLTDDTTQAAVIGAAIQTGAVCQKITASSSTQISYVVMIGRQTGTPQIRYCQMTIRADSAGSPGAVITNGTSTPQIALGTISQNITFNFANSPSVVSGTVYWFCFECINIQPGAPGMTFIVDSKAGATGNVKITVDNYSTFSTGSVNNLYYQIFEFASGNVINGLYDYRFGAPSTQRIMASAGGTLYYHARNATPLTGDWTSLTTGLASGQNSLFDFKTFKNLEFSADGTNIQRVWDGAVAYTIAQGFRATFTLTDSGAAGSLGAGYYWVMPVTTLISGGFRSGIPTQIHVTAGSHQIIVGSIVMNGTGATNFGFDIAALATTWYMTAVTAASTTSPGEFKMIPVGNVTGGINPLANSATTFNITSDAGLSADSNPTLLDNYNLEQGYFTSQITTPIAQYMAVWQGFLVMNDIANPSYIRISSQSEPMIWSTFGGIQGAFEEINTNDGEVITGLYVHDGFLYVFKRHSVFMVQYTFNSAAPFYIHQISANVGSLSHWSAKGISDMGIAFMSQKGPALASGSTVELLPASRNITNKFEPNDPTRYNLAAMQYTTAGLNTTKRQIWWGVSSINATTRDLTLVYDYGNQAFWESDNSANFYQEITDSNFLPTIWSGDYSAQVFQMDTGTNDNGAAIAFNFYTPDIQIGAPFYLKRVDQLHIAGAVQSSGTLSVDVYLDFSSTSTATYTFDMTNPVFQSGLAIPLGLNCKAISLNIRNSELNVPVFVYNLGFSYQMLREAIGSA